jgi:hypothetical protein
LRAKRKVELKSLFLGRGILTEICLRRYTDEEIEVMVVVEVVG